jgi:hypothetical protein
MAQSGTTRADEGVAEFSISVALNNEQAKHVLK